MYNILLLIHLTICLALIGFILLQQGRSVHSGLMGSGGVSHTVFGSKGAKSFLSRSTAFLAAAFFIVSLLLAAYNTRLVKGNSTVLPQNIPVTSVPQS